MKSFLRKFLPSWPVSCRARVLAGLSSLSVLGCVLTASYLLSGEKGRAFDFRAVSLEQTPAIRFPERVQQEANLGRLQAMNVAPVQDGGLALQWHLMAWPNSWFERFPLTLDQNLQSARAVQNEERSYWSNAGKSGSRHSDLSQACPQTNPLTPSPSRIWDSAMLNSGKHLGELWLSDSMVDHRHPDLEGIVDVRGDSGKFKPDSHGTHVAGLMSALRNADGVVGVVPGLQLVLHPLSLTLTREGPRISGREVLESLDEMIVSLVAQDVRGEKKNRVILLSWSFLETDGVTPDFLESLEGKIRKLLEHDVVVVVPAGNFEKGRKQTNQNVYPAAWSGRFQDSNGSLLPVASLDFCGRPSWFSNLAAHETGSVLMAPGERIYSTLPNSDFGFLSGTSASAAQIAAVLAFTAQQYPDVDMKTQVQTLVRTSLPLAFNSERLLSFDAPMLVQGLMSEYGWIAKH